VRKLLRGLLFLEMTPTVLERALEPFPIPLRTLDALHVASIHHLRVLGDDVSLSTFDRRMSEAARAMGIPLWDDRSPS
jgi:predicted nucleic acid-binding protein